jgi:hypothetical protein
MTQFIYNLCLLYIIVINHIDMKIMSMQIDDIFILTDQSFAIVKKKVIHSAKIMTKTREQLIFENSLKFNDIKIEQVDLHNVIYFRQETHI